MFRVGDSIVVDRAPDEVFGFVADLRNFPLWRANLARSTIVSENVTGVGAQCEEEMRIGSRTIPGTCRITTFDDGRTFTFRAVSPGLQYDGRAEVRAEGSGSHFTLSGDITLSGPLRLLQPVLRRRIQEGVHSEVAAIKAHLERA